MNIGLVFLIAIIAVVFTTRYLLTRRRNKYLKELHLKAQKDMTDFLTTFNPSTFNDFSTLDFNTGRYSFVAPFPNRDHGEWRYMIYLTDLEAEDTTTIIHEIVEFTLGRIIEKLLNLKEPLYIQRKKKDKFWVPGKKQKYVLEHVLTTLCELSETNYQELKNRLGEEDLKTWLNTKN